MSYSSSSPAQMLTGVVERVTHHNDVDGYAILKVKVRGQREPVTVTGKTPRVVAGEKLSASGEWVNNPEYGRQFKAAEIQLSMPESVEGLERYLGSGLIDGIGPKYAKRIVQKFGEKVFEVIENESARLEEVDGVGRKRRQEIRTSWMKQKIVHEIMIYLHRHGVSTSRAQRIYKTYGDDALTVLKENPYRLAEDIHGIGFKTADEIAAQVGMDRDSPQRVRAGLQYAMNQAAANGHACFPRHALLEEGEKLLGLAHEQLEEGVHTLLKSEELISDQIENTEFVYLPYLYHGERSIARRVLELQQSLSAYPEIQIPAALDWCEKHARISLAESQKEAIAAALKERVLIITGGPGVGKTTIINSILSILIAKGVKPVLAAPTGRAAQRLAASTKLDASTMHRLLEFQGDGQWGRHAGRTLSGDLFVVDEASMIDTPLMAQFLSALPHGAHLLIVGDADQLPSVGPGTVLQDLIRSGRVACVQLTEIFRQAAQSQIVTAAHAINQGAVPDLKPQPDGDFFFLEREDSQALQKTVVELCRDRLPAKYGFDPLNDIQVLCPMNVQELGTRRFNQLLQAALNPPHEMKFEIERGGQLYRTGDKVIQTRNNYDKETFNGDIGHIIRIDTEPLTVVVRFENGKDVSYEPGDLDQLQLAYAITIHKSQGSEFPCVIIPCSMAQFIMLERSLIYTAVTRGRKLVVMSGETRALEMAVKKTGARRRWTGLRQRLRMP